jgi:hypothetical protein
LFFWLYNQKNVLLSIQKPNRENYLFWGALGGGIGIGYGKPYCFRLKSRSKEQK